MFNIKSWGTQHPIIYANRRTPERQSQSDNLKLYEGKFINDIDSSSILAEIQGWNFIQLSWSACVCVQAQAHMRMHACVYKL